MRRLPFASAPWLATLFAPALLLTACGGEDAETDEAAAGTPDAPIAVSAGGKADSASDDGVPTLTFDADFGETLSAPVVAGGQLRVRFDLDRIPDCRGTQGGIPQWGATGYYAVDGGEAKTFDPSQDALIDVPRGADLALWFSVNNRWGCVVWDSNYGENYHVAIETPAAEAEIVFPAEGDVTYPAEGDVVAGGLLRVDYDLDRLDQCRSSQGGQPQWGATGHLSVGGGPDRSFEISRVEDGERVAQTAVLEVPAGGSLRLWFEATGRYGCHQVDDAGGAGYVLDIAQ